MKHLLIAMLLAITGQTFAQIKVEGTVKDSTGSALELANVIAINKATSELESYGITNEAGKFKLVLKKNTTYNIQVSYIGYKTLEEELLTKATDITKDFVLKEDNSLEAVELVYEIPVKISGDTITYNADSFKKPTDRKLGDVLKNLPGVEVNEAGEVEVEGKTVSKLMVNGKDFFDGDTKLGTKSIPANSVDKVEVLKNFAEIGQLRGVQDNSDNVALNIKLKKGKENFWFGDITAGGGVSNDDGLYLFQPKLFYYSPKYSLNIIGDLNNIGEVVLSRRDVSNFGGGFRAPSNNSGTSINLGNNGIGFLAIQNNSALDVNTSLAATNFSYSPTKALDLSGFAIFSGSRVDTREVSSSQFVQFEDDPNTPQDESSQTPPDENTESTTRQRGDIGLFKLSAKYKPNFRNQLEYDIQTRISDNSQDQGFSSSVTGNTNEFEESTPYSITQSLNYYYTLNENNIFAFSAQYLLQDEDPFYNALLENNPLNNDNPSDPNDLLDDPDAFDATALGLGLDRSLTNYNISQERRVKTNQLDSKLDYWNVLNDKSNINLTLGVISSQQDLDSDFFQNLGTSRNDPRFNPTPIINDGLDTNNIEYNFTDLYAGFHYQLKTGIFTLTPGFKLHSYNVNNRQFGEEFDDDFFRILPDFTARIQLKKSESIRLRYDVQTQFNDVNQFARGIVLNNFNSIFSGNPELENALSHNVNVNYSSFNLFNYTNVFGIINYRKSIDQVQSQTDFSSVVRTRTPFNSTLDNESLTAFGSYQRTIKKVQATLRANFSYNRFSQLIQGRPSVNENYNQTYTARLRTNFRKAPNVQLAYNYSIADNDQGGRRTQFFTNAPSIQFDAYIFKSLTFKTNYSYTRLSDGDRTLNTFDFWDASLSYKKNNDSRWEYEIKATNLLDTASRTRTTSSAFSVNVNETFIQPRYITFRLRYEL